MHSGRFSHSYSQTAGFGAEPGRVNSLQDSNFGAVAQLGEHLLCTQGVVGSSPIRSMPQGLLFV